ncbi:Glyoxalase/Bleomycin resistance protein/Dihydroxybiphenyl dioxygenase [Macrophomina phaseolina]|uniref:Glyoxalase/Bleomycin resistance protein/Dihydroxybiphenyl dioxygenase n=1 Tax=Macrophomina phaseolina TaxID=35725 RepID=A0ABQ8GNF4_9PEZI|nr:Glyoxalase/Bleomycin resistance protein/Dihydroxybiphenyl dioxygenase [Macrophomina phaseolina]
MEKHGKPTKIISPVKLAHVVLRTRPEMFKQMVDFYKTFLGADASYENDTLSFLTYDDEHHRIALAAVPGLGPKDAQTSGLEHIAFTFASIHDLLGAYTQRKQLGVCPIWCVNHGPTLSIYYRDPDGNTIETQVDCFDSAEAATAQMRSDEFNENPIGVDFDPEDLIVRLEKGESVEEVLLRPRIGKRDLTSVPLMA